MRLRKKLSGKITLVAIALLSLSAGISAQTEGMRRTVGDFFGTGRTSFAVVSQPGSQRTWRLKSNGSDEISTVNWGNDTFDYTDRPAPGHFDGDDKTDVAVWRSYPLENTGIFLINPSTNVNSMHAFQWGIATDLAANLAADYDGDGLDDYTVARNIGGHWVWYIYRSSDGAVKIHYFGNGNAGVGFDQPMRGADYDDDGNADITVRRRGADGSATYLIGDANSGAMILAQQWGLMNADQFMIGDYLGDRRADFAVWRGSGANGTGVWYIKENGGDQVVVVPFGIPNAADAAVRGDYNGDGKADIAIYRSWHTSGAADNNTFYWLNSPNFNTVGIYKFGQVGDGAVNR